MLVKDRHLKILFPALTNFKKYDGKTFIKEGDRRPKILNLLFDVTKSSNKGTYRTQKKRIDKSSRQKTRKKSRQFKSIQIGTGRNLNRTNLKRFEELRCVNTESGL